MMVVSRLPLVRMTTNHQMNVIGGKGRKKDTVVPVHGTNTTTVAIHLTDAFLLLSVPKLYCTIISSHGEVIALLLI